VSKSICNNSCISSDTTFSKPSCGTYSGDHNQCDKTLEKGWEGGVPAEGETGTWAREGCYSAGNEGEVGSCLSDGKVTNQRVRCDSNTDPTAKNDPVSMKECTKSATIDVLDNDTDDDGDNIEIKSVDNYPSNGIANVDNGKIVYTPDDNTDTSFSYTIKDGNGGEGTGQVDVSFSSCQGSITVEIEDTNGNSKSADSIQVEYDGDVKNLGSGPSGSTDVDLKDSGADAVIQKSDIDPPDGYNVRESGWVEKDEDVPTYNNPNRSELGF
jgi:hypothetical protein